MDISPKIQELTYKVVGLCMNVHREVGPGFPEEYYQKALEVESTEAQLAFEAQKPVTMMYKDVQIGMNYLDFDVNETLIMEIKSVASLTNVHLFQVLKYLAVTRRQAALLVNFGRPSLEYKRVLPTKKMQAFWNKEAPTIETLHPHHSQ